MELVFQYDYTTLNDKELVDKIITMPYNDEAAAYLIYRRYDPLLLKIYRNVFDKNISWYGDCLGDLFEFLKGKDRDWNKLRTFEWKSQFGTWLSRTAYNRFLEIKPKLTGKLTNTISIDVNHDSKSSLQLPDEGESDYERRERNILLLEAVSLLKDPDQRFVIMKRLQGYNSKEIALLMQERWEKHGIVKYNNKKQIVVPDAAYIDVRAQRAKDNLAIILKKLR